MSKHTTVHYNPIISIATCVDKNDVVISPYTDIQISPDVWFNHDNGTRMTIPKSDYEQLYSVGLPIDIKTDIQLKLQSYIRDENGYAAWLNREWLNLHMNTPSKETYRVRTSNMGFIINVIDTSFSDISNEFKSTVQPSNMTNPDSIQLLYTLETTITDTDGTVRTYSIRIGFEYYVSKL